MKATLPFIIILGHIYQHTGHLSDFHISGMYCVGLFFFISGYGLGKKDQITCRYIIKRITKVLLPLIVPILVFLTIQYSVFHQEIGAMVKNSLLHYELIVPYSWFFITLITLYVIFHVCTAIARKNNFLLIIFLFVSLCLFSLVHMYLGLQGTYRLSNFAFLGGVIMSKYEKEIMRLCKNTKAKIIVASFLAISTLFAINSFRGIVHFNVFVWTFLVAIVLCYIKDFSNRFIVFFKNMSFELYVCQGISFLLIPYDGTQYAAYAISIISLTIALAWFSSRINIKFFRIKRNEAINNIHANV